MRHYILTTILLLAFCACYNLDKQKKNVAIISNDSFLQDTNDSTKTTKQILNKLLPSVLALAKADTSAFYYGENVIEKDSLLRQLLVGKFIDKRKVIATEINIRDNIINFFYLDKDHWKLIGSEKTNISIYKIEFEDLDGDDKNEIVTSSFSNMNGNSWKEIYYYSDKTNTIKYAGSFSTDYEVKKQKKQIEETYEGSWYMDQSKTLYEWRSEKLVPIKQIILAHEQNTYENGKLTFEYYENSINEIEGLKLKFKEPYTSDKKQKDLWDNFFTK